MPEMEDLDEALGFLYPVINPYGRMQNPADMTAFRYRGSHVGKFKQKLNMIEKG
jgi:hypothetical protein